MLNTIFLLRRSSINRMAKQNWEENISEIKYWIKFKLQNEKNMISFEPNLI